MFFTYSTTPSECQFLHATCTIAGNIAVAWQVTEFVATPHPDEEQGDVDFGQQLPMSTHLKKLPNPTGHYKHKKHFNTEVRKID